METVDEVFPDRAKSFIRRKTRTGKPWMTWMNTSRMHFFTHLKPERRGVTGLGICADGMVEHDKHVGQLLDLLDELKITDDTIVIATAGNGPHFNEWPDGGNTWFRSGKNTNGEGSYRVPGMVCWPARIKARDDLWIRFVVMLASIIGFYVVQVARTGLDAFIPWTVPRRHDAAAFMVPVVLIGKAGPALLLLAAIDAATATGTLAAL